MIIATTASINASENSPVVYRGTFQEIFPKIEEDGYRAVELHCADTSELDQHNLYEQLERSHLTLTSIGTGAAYRIRHWGITDKNTEIRNNAIKFLEKQMKVLSPYKGVLIIGSMQGRIRDAGSVTEFEKNLSQSLYILDSIADMYGVKIGFEIMNHYESDFLYCIHDGIQYLQTNSFRHVGLHIDTVHMNIDESDLGKSIRDAGSAICHVHLADNDRYYPGHGHMNFREIFQALQDIHYDEALALETLPRPDVRTCGRRSLEYIHFIQREVCGCSVI